MRTTLNYVGLLVVVACSRGKTPAAADSPRAQASGTAATSSAPVPSPQHPAPLPATQHPSTTRSILFAGTSLTAGQGLETDSAYPQQIQRMIDSAGLGYSVINAGVSGETSSGLLSRLDWLLRQPHSVVVIETGANDGLRGIPIETMQKNIQETIERVRAARPEARIVLVQMEAPPNLGDSYTRRFRQVFPEVAKQTKVVLLPFLLDSVAGQRELNQADGIHPNYDGERIVARNVWKGLRPLLR
jgi:acyl-CoA thioesterase I